MRRFVAALTFLLLVFFPTVVFAQEGGTSRLDLTVNQGPGYLLPTSPLYFADVLKNNLRLLFAGYDLSAKAKLHLEIAGERIAEIKVMLEDDTLEQYALDASLGQLADNVTGAKTALRKYKNKGMDSELLASELNTIINAQKESLRTLQTKTDPQSTLKLEAALAKVREVELGIEDEMAADLRRNEESRELAAEIAETTRNASSAADKAAALQEQLAANERGSVAGIATESSSKKPASKSAVPKNTQPVE